MILLEGQINCLRISKQWHKAIPHQAFTAFLNKYKFDLKLLNESRVEELFTLAQQNRDSKDILNGYVLFSIDPSDFIKYKHKKMQAVRASGDGKSKYLAHSFILSSFICGNTTIPFKKTLYWGKKTKKKRPSKEKLFLKLVRKANRFYPNGNKILVTDGEGAKAIILREFTNNKSWLGAVMKFPRTRNIIIGEEKIHIRKYLSNLKEDDFSLIKVDGKDHYIHHFQAQIPSLAFLGICQFVVIQDEKGNLSQKSLRVLFTNIAQLSAEQILCIYSRRWKQETYHQIIKDRLGVRAYKHRRLIAIIRLLELADLAYSFLEFHRLKQKNLSYSISDIRNAFISNAESAFANKFNLPRAA